MDLTEMKAEVYKASKIPWLYDLNAILSLESPLHAKDLIVVDLVFIIDLHIQYKYLFMINKWKLVYTGKCKTLDILAKVRTMVFNLINNLKTKTNKKRKTFTKTYLETLKIDKWINK